MSKIDVTPIVASHFKTLRDNRFGSKISKPDIAIFFAFPVAFAIFLPAVGFGFRGDAVNGLLNAFSILTGLLLNLLVLVFTLASSAAPPGVDGQKRKTLLTEVFTNVCFSLLTAISVVCIAVVALSYMKSSAGATTGRVTTFLFALLTMNFILTVLMVIKRMYILLRKDIDRVSVGKAA